MRISLDRNEDGVIRVYCTVCMETVPAKVESHTPAITLFAILKDHVEGGHGTDEAYPGII